MRISFALVCTGVAILAGAIALVSADDTRTTMVMEARRELAEIRQMAFDRTRELEEMRAEGRDCVDIETYRKLLAYADKWEASPYAKDAVLQAAFEVSSQAGPNLELKYLDESLDRVTKVMMEKEDSWRYGLAIVATASSVGYNRRGESDVARRVRYRMVLRIMDDNWTVLTRQCSDLAEDAKQCLKPMSELFPNDEVPSNLVPALLEGRASLVESTGNIDEALKAWDRLLTEYPGTGWADHATSRKEALRALAARDAEK